MNANPITKDYSHFEDLHIGQVIDLGQTKVTKQMIVEFASKFDPFPFHLDEEYAKKSLLGGLCASGWHTAALAIKACLDNFPNKLASGGGLGFENIKWKKPLMVNDIIGGTVTISNMRRSASNPQWGIITLNFDVCNQRGETIMLMTLNNLVDVRNPSAKLEEA